LDSAASACISPSTSVLEVDAAEGRLEAGDDFDQVGVRLGDLDIEDVDAGE
jgi:hypothetical protein